MASGIIPRTSSTAGRLPTTSQLQTGEIAFNSNDGKLYALGNNGSAFVQLLGGPGFLKSHPQWFPAAGSAAIENYEFGPLVYNFGQGLSQALVAWVRVPNAFNAGTAITLKFNAYTPDTTSSVYFKLQAVTTLIRNGVDAVTSTANQYTSTNAQTAVPSTANQNVLQSCDLTSTSGQINSITPSPGDLLIVTLSRVTPTGTDSSVDVRMVPFSNEILFS